MDWEQGGKYTGKRGQVVVLNEGFLGSPMSRGLKEVNELAI